VKVFHKTVKVGDLDIFYREAGPKDAPTILLLHGFPTSSQRSGDLGRRQRKLARAEYDCLQREHGHYRNEHDAHDSDDRQAGVRLRHPAALKPAFEIGHAFYTASSSCVYAVVHY